MFVGANWNGQSKPIFNVRKKNNQRQRRSDVNIRKVITPFMADMGSDFLIMDNAKVQTYQANFLEELKITGPGFAAKWVNVDGGQPPRP